MIPAQELAGPIPNISYRSSNWSGHTGFTNIGQGSASYITGSHSAKVGFRLHQNISTFPKDYFNDSQLRYHLTNGVPTAVTVYGGANPEQEQHQFMTAVYAQDRWTLGRLSLQGGLRFEHLSDYFPEQRIGPNRFVPTAIVFPPQEGPLSQKDLMPRFGAAYDVFGDGKTAAKFFVGRYVTTFNTVDEWANYSPAGLGRFVSEDQNRPWTDANGDFVPNCVFTNPAANGECGPGNPGFLNSIPPLTTDPDLTGGWNSREYSWDLNAGITQQIAPRVSVQVDYIRRSWGNLTATVNRAWTPADFDTFTFTAPSDPKLPGGGGYNVTFRDVKPDAFTRTRRQLPDLCQQSRRRLQQVQRRRRDGERAPARRHPPGRYEQRQRGRGLVRCRDEPPRVLHLRTRGAARADSSTPSSVASGSGRSSSVTVSRAGRRTSRGWPATRCRRSTC